MRLIDSDALKRKAQKVATEAWKMKLKSPVETVLNQFIDWIDAQPTIEPEQRWIPVEERLPDDLAEVNVTWVNHEPEPYYDFVKDKPFTASAVYYKGDWYWYSSACVDILAEYGKNEIDKLDDAIEITAWMPFPEPYQERGETKGL